jgi:DNA-binding NtrC family response regulator
MNARVLIIDDENLFREDLAFMLKREGYDCATAPDAERGLELIAEFRPDVVLSDIVMPGKSGIELLSDISRDHTDCSVIIMTAFGTLETAIDAFRKGAVDYILKPVVPEDLLLKVARTLEHKRLVGEITLLRRQLEDAAESQTLVGESEATKKVLALIQKVGPTKSTVLITGESGTGKELVARGIHTASEMREEPFVAINCSGFQEALLESELFGHVKGAFTGAIKDKTGFLEAAKEGTVFLDEISEMPVPLQSKLLRVLEQREFYRVGGTNTVALKARIIAATNVDPKALVEQEVFREDLYYRLAVLEIRVPSLRERASDIPPLVEHFIEQFNREMRTRYTGVSADALQMLMSYRWPGNVRELRNVIERAMILCDGEEISVDGLPTQIAAGLPETPRAKKLRDAVHAYEAAFIRRVLTDCGWNKEKAARELGINPSTLYRKMLELDITDPTAHKD